MSRMTIRDAVFVARRWPWPPATTDEPACCGRGKCLTSPAAVGSTAYADARLLPIQAQTVLRFRLHTTATTMGLRGHVHYESQDEAAPHLGLCSRYDEVAVHLVNLFM